MIKKCVYDYTNGSGTKIYYVEYEGPYNERKYFRGWFNTGIITPIIEDKQMFEGTGNLLNVIRDELNEYQNNKL